MLMSEANAFTARFESLNRRRSQQVMLAGVFGFVAVLSVVMLAMAERAGVAGQWLVLRFVMGEFLVAWLVADHVTGVLQRARDSGELQEWRLIPGSAESVTLALVRTTRQFLWLGIGIWAVVEVPMSLLLTWEDPRFPLTTVGLLVLFGLHLSGVSLAAAIFSTTMLRSRWRMGRAWLWGGFSLLGAWLFVLLIVGILFGVMMELMTAARLSAPMLGFIVVFLVLAGLAAWLREKLAEVECVRAVQAFVEQIEKTEG
jgi:hypothetical protein